MMRDIKFRSWLIEQGEMLYRFSMDSVMKSHHDKRILTQYTGLKDRNGVDIFEGDIVEISGHAFEGSIRINGYYEVSYNERMELCCGNLILHRQLPYVSVVGNIYENAHLLNETEG